MKLVKTVFVIYILSQVEAYRNVEIGFIHFTSIYDDAPNREILKRAIPIGTRETCYAIKTFETYLKDTPHEVNGEEVKFDFIVKESDYSPQSIEDQMCELLNRGIRIIISPFGTGPGLQVASIVTENTCNIPNLGNVIQLSGSTQERTFSHNSPSSFSTMPTLYNMVSALIPYYRDRTTNVTMIKTEGSRPGDPAATVCSGLEEKFFESGISTIETVWYDGDFTNTEKDHYIDVVDKVIDIGHDLIIYCGINKNIMDTIAAIFKENDYTPKGAISTVNEFHLNETITDFWTVASSTTKSDLSFPNLDFFQSEEEYAAIYSDLFSKEFGDDGKMGLFTAFACEIILKAMQMSGSVDDIDLILDEIIKKRFNTLLGDIYFSSKRENKNSGISLQKLPDSMAIIGPYQVSNTSIIYPMPTWKERDFKTSYHGSEIATITLMSLTFINVAICVGIASFKQIQNIAYIITNSGVILICVGMILWMPSHVSSTSCMSTSILIVLGLSLVIGSLVFDASKIKFGIQEISKTILFMIIAYIALETIILILWGLFGSYVAERDIIDVYRPYKNHLYCKYEKYTSMFLGISSAPIIFIYLFGVYLTIAFFLGPSKKYRRLKYYAFSLYNIGFCVVFMTILELVGISGNVYAQHMLKTVISIVSMAIIVNITFMQLFVGDKRKKNLSTSSSFNSSQRASSISSSRNEQERQMYYKDKVLKSEKEHRELKKEVRELRKKIDEYKNTVR